jgi:hypothetical protein
MACYVHALAHNAAKQMLTCYYSAAFEIKQRRYCDDYTKTHNRLRMCDIRLYAFNNYRMAGWIFMKLGKDIVPKETAPN